MQNVNFNYCEFCDVNFSDAKMKNAICVSDAFAMTKYLHNLLPDVIICMFFRKHLQLEEYSEPFIATVLKK